MDTPSASLWQSTSACPSFPKLEQDLSCDVGVVGGGIAGITTAYLAARAGLSVVLLEDGAVGSGETGRTSAHLSNALDDRYEYLEQKHGAEGARLIAESHTAAIDWIERTSRQEAIDCEFERIPGYLFVPPDGDPSELDREFEAARRAGVNVHGSPRAPWIHFNTGRCLVFENQAQFHPLKYLYALASRAARCGARIYTQTHVNEVEGGAEAHLGTKSGHRVNARHLVIATNVPINDRVAIHTKQAAYRTYVIGARADAGSAAPALYWDTADPYHYVRIEPVDRPDEILLIIGGEDHKTGQDGDPRAHYGALEVWARQRFPKIRDIAYRWSGQIIEPIDGAAFIGRNPGRQDNVFIVTGDSGNGLTHGTLAGLLIGDLIQNRENPWAAVYDPSRKPVGATGEFLKENLNVLPQYLDWLSPGSVKTVQEIRAGEGAVVRDGLQKMAVYREPSGELHAVSAVCPHLKCLVKWNSGEKTWDCPCHGSRFEPEGKVLNGPAVSDLAPVAPAKIASL